MSVRTAKSQQQARSALSLSLYCQLREAAAFFNRAAFLSL